MVSASADEAADLIAQPDALIEIKNYSEALATYDQDDFTEPQ